MKFDKILMSAVEHDLQNGLIPMLLGEPGIGKSSWIIALGQHLHTKVFVLPCNQLADKADLTGARLVPVTKVVRHKDGTTEEVQDYEQRFYPHVVICRAIDYAESHPTETPILFMDELNRTTPDVTSEALSIPTLRSIGYRKLPDNLRVITAGNDKGNITALDEASISRFALYHVTPDVNTYLSLDDSLNPFVKNVLTQHPETIFGKHLPASLSGAGTNQDDDEDGTSIDDIFDDGEEMFQITTPRTITGVSRWLNSYTNDDLKSMLGTTVTTEDGDQISVLQEMLEGHTGKTAFTAMLLSEISQGVNTINSQANVFTVPKPACWDVLAGQASMSDMNDYITQMTDNDKAGCLVYAMYDKSDNSDIIESLVPQTQILSSDDTQNLFKLFTAKDAISEVNKEAFFSVKNSRFVESFRTLFA